jgi:hypothetical protein
MRSLLQERQRVPHELLGMFSASCADDLHGEDVSASVHGRAGHKVQSEFGRFKAGSNQVASATAVNQKGELN